MLKIYLDWNCITASKTDYSFIPEFVKKYSHVAVFPYSEAHLSDVLVSRNNHPEEFAADLQLLHDICGNHLLHFHNHRINPGSAYPEEVVEKYGDLLELIQTTSWMTPDTYQVFKTFVKNNLPNYPLTEIQRKTEPEDVIAKINEYLRQHSPFDNLLSFMGTACSQKDMSSPEFQFQLLDIGLDMFGYKTEGKRKSITNIMTDASHMFIAANCDYFVTRDRVLRDKAKAVYAYYKCKTKVIHPDELKDILCQAHAEAFSLDYMTESIRLYGTPRIEDDGNHYTLLPIPFFGFFDVCMTGKSLGGNDAAWAVFRYSFAHSPYLFYSEVQEFLELICNAYPENQREGFWSLYADPIIRRDMESARGRQCSFLFEKESLQFTLMVDVENQEPIPMLKVEYVN